MADLGILAAEIPTELANRIPNQPTHVSVNFDNRAGMVRSTYPKVVVWRFRTIRANVYFLIQSKGQSYKCSCKIKLIKFDVQTRSIN